MVELKRHNRVNASRINVTKMTIGKVMKLMDKMRKEGKDPHIKTRLRQHFIVYKV